MDGDAARRARELFLDALERPPEERAAFLAEGSADDPAVGRRAAELLAAHEASSAIFAPLDGLARLAAPPELEASGELGPGARVGPYEVRRKLGSGGFGVVYLAEQTEPVVRRVALKLLRSGLGSPSARVRFAAERQALARMEHPGIARVFDADETPDGTPYFAMEYVPGEHLTDHCEQRALGLEARLRLFESVCQAVAHAHQRGVLHRDLKPSNVLVLEVDGEPHVKVIDFGVAKAIDEPLIDSSLRSVAGELIGTPAYMSPEQASGERDLDTRADVYALGALLYELLTGRPPFDARGKSLPTLLRAILEEEPVRPSRRASAGGETATRRRIPPDLDWIAMRCLEKDRARRYPSAVTVAEDVRRFLDGRPVEAAPPGTWYRARKLVRRHRWAALSTAALVVAALVAGIGILFGLLRAREERHVSDSVLAFLREDLLAAARPAAAEGRGKDVKLIEAVDAAARRIESGTPAERLGRQPRVLAAIRVMLADLYGALGEFERSASHSAAALELFELCGLRDSPEALGCASFHASMLRRLGRLDEAIALATDTLAAQLEELGRSAAPVIHTRVRLAYAVAAAGDSSRGRRLAEEALADLELVEAPDPLLLSLVHNALGVLNAADQRLEEAEEHFRRVVEIDRLRHEAGDPKLFESLGNLASNLQAQGRYEEAIALLGEALGAMGETLGSAHPSVLKFRLNRGRALAEVQRLGEAEEALRAVLADSEAALGAGHPDTASARGALGECLTARGNLAEAEECLRRAYADTLAAVGPDASDAQTRRQQLYEFLFEIGRVDGEAVALAEEDVASRRRTAGPEHVKTLRAEANLALCLKVAGRAGESEDLYRRLLATSERALGAGHPETMETRGDLVDLLVEGGRLEEAEELARRSLEVLGPETTDRLSRGRAWARLGFLLVEKGSEEEARRHLEEARADLADASGPDDVWVRYVDQVLGELGAE